MSPAFEPAWGAATQRALENFPISGHVMPRGVLRALGLFKQCAARANQELGQLSEARGNAIVVLAREIAAGEHAAQFPVDVFQTGSGTSTNTNVNEVIAGLALRRFDGLALHPNDHVNRSQSSNDVMPTVLHVSVALALEHQLAPALKTLERALGRKATELSAVVKLGRTHLMDAVPMTLGQEFSGYTRQLAKASERARRARDAVCELAVGGTAVGTGLHAPRGFAARVCQLLADETGLPFREAENHFEAQGARDDCVEVAGVLATIAASLDHVAGDLRLLASGPRGGLGELRLPTLQPGSSIMPGKVNPVLCESVNQVAMYVQGLTTSVGACGRAGQLELNATLPLIAWCLHESISCLSNVAQLFADRCVSGLQADPARCLELAERSLMVATALTPLVGYDRTAQVVQQAERTGASIHQVASDLGLLDAKTLGRLLDPRVIANLSDGRQTTEDTWENEGGAPHPQPGASAPETGGFGSQPPTEPRRRE